MPTYSYRCTQCDNTFDIHQAFTDKTLSICPLCGGELRKVFSPVGVTFKGSGFYRTDSRVKPDGRGGKKPHSKSGAKAGGSDSSSGGSDSSSASTTSGSDSSSASTTSGPASTGTSSPSKSSSTRKSGSTRG